MESQQSEHGHQPTAQNLSPDREDYQPRQTVYLREMHKEPVRINADDESKLRLFFYAIAVILPIILIVLITVFALPSAMVAMDPNQSLKGTNLESCSALVRQSTQTPNLLRCYTNSSFTANTANSMGIYVKLFSNLNQFMLFYIDLSPYANSQTNKNARFNQTILFTIYSASYSKQSGQTTLVGKLHEEGVVINSKLSRLARRKVLLGYQSKIAYGQQFYIETTFKNNSSIIKSSDFYLQVETVRQNFTIYTILLRVAFFIVALVVLVLYTIRMLKVPKRKVSIEQKGIQIIGALTLLFDDQLYFITVLWPNPVSSFLSALFIWSYLFGLYVLWTSFMLRILHDQPDTETIQLKRPLRIVLLVLFYLIGLTFCAGYGIIQSGEYPMISVNDIDYTWFRVYLGFIIFCLVMALCYLLWLFIAICRKHPLRSHRHNVFLVLSAFYILVIVIVTLMGSFQVYNFSGGLIFFTFAFANSYSFFLMYLYSPTQNQLITYRLGEYEMREYENNNWQQGKSIDIELVQQQSQKDKVDKLIDIDLQSSKNSQKSDKKSQLSIRRRKRRASQHQKQNEQHKKNTSQTHDRINKQKQMNNHNDISIEQQHYGDDY